MFFYKPSYESKFDQLHKYVAKIYNLAEATVKSNMTKFQSFLTLEDPIF